jgi:hypothetical protein
MKANNGIVGILLVVMLALAGCGKAPPPPPPTSAGVTIDLPKLQAAFSSPSSEMRVPLDEVAFGLRYDDYNKSLAALAKLASAPNLTEPQKKVINDVTEQVKAAAAAAAAKAGR